MRHVLQTATAVTLAVVATILAADAQSTAPSGSAPSVVAPSADPVPNPSPVPTPVNPPENPLVTDRVRHEFGAWQQGRINRASYSPQAGGTYMDAVVGQVQPNLQAIGAAQTVTYETTSLLFGDFVYRYDIQGTQGAVSVLYSLDDHGKTDGIVFTPLIFTAPSPTPTPSISPLPAMSAMPSVSPSPSM